MKATAKTRSASGATTLLPALIRMPVWTKLRSAPEWLSYALLAGSAAVVAFMIYLVCLAYSPLLWVDQWMFLQGLIANHGRYSLELLWKQHNEHRIPLAKLFSLTDLYLFGGRNLFLHAAVFGVQFVHLAWLAVSFRRIGQLPALAWRTSVAVAVCSLFWVRQVENFVFPWNIAMILPYLGATIAFSSLGFFYLSVQDRERGAFRYLLYSWAGIVIGSLSFTSGLLLWPMVVLTMFVLRVQLQWVLATAALGAALIGCWLSGHSIGAGHHAIPSVLLMLRFVLLFFGSSWSCVSDRLGMMLALIALPSATGAYIWVLLKRPKDTLAVVLLSLAMFALASAVLIAFGRSEMGLDQARTERYQTGPLLFWCCVSVLIIRRAAKAVRAPVLMIGIQFGIVYVLVSAAGLAPQYAAGLRLHSNTLGVTALALEAGVNDSTSIMYAAIPPYQAEDILVMSDYLRARHWSIFNGEQVRPLGKDFGRFYHIVASAACRGAMDSTRGIADYRWSGFRFSGWAYDVAAHAPASAVALVDSHSRLIGIARSGFQRADAPSWAPRERAGFLGYVSADLKAHEIRAFAILADGVSACPMLGGAPLYVDLLATAYSGLAPSGPTYHLTRDLRPAISRIETLGSNPVSNGPHVLSEPSNETLITGWIVDSRGHSGVAADLVVDGVPLPAQYGYERPDVARLLSSPEATGSGFRCRLPKLPSGKHRLAIRVIPKDQDIYCEHEALTILLR